MDIYIYIYILMSSEIDFYYTDSCYQIMLLTRFYTYLVLFYHSILILIKYVII